MEARVTPGRMVPFSGGVLMCLPCTLAAACLSVPPDHPATITRTQREMVCAARRHHGRRHKDAAKRGPTSGTYCCNAALFASIYAGIGSTRRHGGVCQGSASEKRRCRRRAPPGGMFGRRQATAGSSQQNNPVSPHKPSMQPVAGRPSLHLCSSHKCPHAIGDRGGPASSHRWLGSRCTAAVSGGCDPHPAAIRCCGSSVAGSAWHGA